MQRMKRNVIGIQRVNIQLRLSILRELQPKSPIRQIDIFEKYFLSTPGIYKQIWLSLPQVLVKQVKIISRKFREKIPTET